MKQLSNSLTLVCILIYIQACMGTTELEQVEWDEQGVLEYECSVLLNSFAKSASNFTYCAVKSARPFKFCCMCSAEYSNLMKTKHDIYVNTKCVSELVLSEKYQIVESMNQFAITLWYTSHCKACFKHHEGIGQKWKITDLVKKFFHELRELQVCFKNNTQVQLIPMTNSTNSTTNSTISNSTHYKLINITSPQVVCSRCRSYYRMVQQTYKDIVNNGQELVNKEDAVCADVAAAMNYTRHTWSAKYNCTNPQKDLISVIALTCFFAFIPFVFYVAVKINGDGKEKRVEVSGLPKINYDTD